MAILIVLVLAIAWFVAWWGSAFFEVRGLARRIEDAIDRRYRVRDEDGLAMSAARGAWAGFATLVVTWGGFVVPIAVLALIGFLAG